MSIVSQLFDRKVIAILRGIPEKYVEQLGQALLDGGILAVEATLNHDNEAAYRASLEQIAHLKAVFGSKMLVGAGTVLSVKEVEDAQKMGAAYIISPNTDEKVIRFTHESGSVSIPGAMTPSEIVTAYNAGADIIKLFPAGSLGAGYFKAVKAPLKHIPMFAVGGVTPENTPAFMKAGALGIGVSSNLTNLQWMAEGRFDLITETARAFVEAVNQK